MNLMICMSGKTEQLSFLPEITELGAGIELGTYGLIGIRSERDWETRFKQHKEIRSRFQDAIAIHGPFIGIEYDHPDHLIRDAVNRRLDMTFDIAMELNASRIVLHSGYTGETDLLNLQDSWIERCVEFWQLEICRWADAGIEIVLENIIEKTPDLIIRLIDEVNNPFLGLCFDIGHQHLFSNLDSIEWVRRMNKRLFHIHLHDNDRTGDHHWPIGSGTIEFEPFYQEILQCVPQATISLEVEGKMEVRMDNLRQLVAYFASKP